MIWLIVVHNDMASHATVFKFGFLLRILAAESAEGIVALTLGAGDGSSTLRASGGSATLRAAPEMCVNLLGAILGGGTSTHAAHDDGTTGRICKSISDAIRTVLKVWNPKGTKPPLA